VRAVRPRTPLHQRVQIHINVLLESQILFVDLLRAKLTDVFPVVLTGTGLVGTFDDLDLAVLDHEVQILGDAADTESVRTGAQALHLLDSRVIVADLAHRPFVLLLRLDERLSLRDPLYLCIGEGEFSLSSLGPLPVRQVLALSLSANTAHLRLLSLDVAVSPAVGFNEEHDGAIDVC